MIRAATLRPPAHDQHASGNAERITIANLIRVSAETGMRVDPSAMVNLYVALKSKPLAIIAGPARSGKVTAVQALAHVLTGGDTSRFHTLVGHAWWAGQSGNVGLFTEAQTRLNTGEIIDLMREAWRPENARCVLVVCLARISPAEVAGLFSEIAFQLRHGQIMQLPGVHLTEPIPYPPNLLLIGTMDVDHFEVPDPDLQKTATVIHWHAASKASRRPRWLSCAAGESVFLHARVRTERDACLKMSHILEQDPASLQPLFKIEHTLKQHSVVLPPWVRGQVLIYLANAWDNDGNGLFDRHAVRQRAVAFDLALAQIVLPHVTSAVVSPELADQLKSVLAKDFPYAASVLDGMSYQ